MQRLEAPLAARPRFRRSIEALLLLGLLTLPEIALAKRITPPRSALHPLLGIEEIDHRVMPEIDLPALLEQDRRPTDRPTPLRVAFASPVNLGLDDAGTWETLPDGGALWRLRFTSAGARFISFKFSDFEVPPGAELHFVSVDWDYHDGPYTERHNRPERRFGSPMIPGDSAVVELYLQDGTGEASLVLESVSHGYREVMRMDRFAPRVAGATENSRRLSGGGAYEPDADFSCQRDINCPEGADYQDDKRAVAEGYDGQFVCSGQLINNVRQDNRYLYITAGHCEWWKDPAGMAYYWNYENSGCGTNDFPPFTFSTGSTDLYHDVIADIDLLELDGTDLETTYDIYFMGWNRGDAPPTSGALISFPDDKPKQITFEYDPVTDCASGGCSDGFGSDFWRVEDWDVGVDEAGSSGGGLLDQDHRLVGVLTGGIGTDCDDFDWVEFAKISPVWSDLQPFLDPDNTGAMALPGKDGNTCAGPGCASPPVADGTTGSPMRLSRGAGGTIVVTYDPLTCAGDRVIIVWGNLGDWSGYQGDVGGDCDLGTSGTGSFEFSGDNVWFNLVWVNGDGAAGHPGLATSAPRSWTAAGLCGALSDDQSDAVCD